jgi:hypothetical protein
MTVTSSLTEPAELALRSLADHPTRTTVSGISNGPYLVGEFGPDSMYDGLIELQGRGLAAQRLGRWHLTARGKERAALSRGTDVYSGDRMTSRGPDACVVREFASVSKWGG